MVGAMCMGPTRRHRARSTVFPCSAAISSATAHCEPSTSKPPAVVAPRERSPSPYLPAARAPAGETCAAGKYGLGLLSLGATRSEEHTSALQSPCNLVCRLLLAKKKETSL